MGRELDRNLLAGIGLIAALVLINAGISLWNTRKVHDDASRVAHSHEVLTACGGVRADVRDLEATQRNFVLMGDDRSLEAFRQAEGHTRDRIARLAELTGDNARQQARIADLEALVRRAVGQMSTTIEVRRIQGLEPARQIVIAGNSRRLLDDIDQTLDEYEREEQALLRERNRETEQAYSTALLFGAASAAFGLGAVAAFVWLLYRSTRARAAAAAGVHQQREWFRTTLASIGDAVITTDTAGRVTFLNTLAEQLTGWSSADAGGRPLSEVFRVVNETTREPVANPARRALEQGVIVGLANHTVLIARDGSERPIDDSAAPIRDETGRVSGAVLVFRDITARRQAEASLRVAEERSEFVRRSSGVGFWYCDLPFDVLVWDERVKAHFHLPPDAHVTIDTFYARLHPDDREATRQAVDRSIAERVVYDVHYRTVDPDTKAEKWVRAIGRTFYDDDGTPKGFDGVTLDVTDRKRAEEALREENRVVETLNAIGARLAAELDLGRLLQMVTDEATVLTGAAFGAFFYNATDGRGDAYLLYTLSGAPREAFEHFPPPRATALFEPTFKGLGVVRLDDVTADPRYGKNSPHQGMPPGHLPVRGYLAVPVRSRSGEVLGGLFLGHSEVGVFNERHERLAVGVAAVAAVAVDNARLYEQLREQDRRKDEFLALLAHELRNPLAPLRNGLQVIRLAADGDEVVRSREMMDRQLTHMVRMIDDLLDVSRISRNKMELRRQRVLLADVVSNAVETVRPAIEAAGHELTISLPEEPVRLDADLTRLAQVFGNLLSNSAKYTEPGGRIGLVATRDGGTVTVQVRDTGIGIPAEFLPNLFDIFSQVDRSIERSTGGLGIGLALVKGMVEMHGGTVEAASDGNGKGSTFTVRLPALEADAEARETPPGQATRLVGSKRRVLVVDDNWDSATSMAMMLELLGYEVHTAHDGVEAVDAAGQFRPQVVLMDVGMPRLNGLDATRRIREQPWGEGMVIIALTGWGQEVDRARSKEAGCDGHLVKPVNLPDLERLLNELTPRPAGR